MTDSQNIRLERIGAVTSDIGAEISAYDAANQLLFVVSGSTEVQVFDLSDPANPQPFAAAPVIDLTDLGAPIGGINSVAFKNGLLALALEAEIQTDPGAVAIVDINTIVNGTPIADAAKAFQAGALPDMVTFSPDGKMVLTANEGEPDDGINPEGSITIVDLSGGLADVTAANVTTANFQAFNGRESELRAAGVRIFPDIPAAIDFEPEYIAVAPNGQQAFVALQENNSVAVLNLATKTVENIVPLGLKDFSQPGNGIDASDRDGAINIVNQPVFGFYMPDGIAAYEVHGSTYYITANEGDDRGDADEAGTGDAIRIKDLGDVVSFGRNGLALDSKFDPSITEDENLGRLTISSVDGDTDGDGNIDQLISYSSRSFSIWDAHGNQVFDSGDQIAQITAAQAPELFNANNGDPEDFDTRSDNKGAEPEAVTIGEIAGRPYAFIGLERAGGGVLVYDVSQPTAPEFVQYARNDEDIAPEGLTFISAEDSPNGKPLLTVANEVSNTIAVYEIDVPQQPDATDTGSGSSRDPGVKQEEPTNPMGDGNGDSAAMSIYGRDYAETLMGSSGNEMIFGNGGMDELIGKAGDDKIYGGSQADRIMAGAGNDVIYANGGMDYINSGSGLDQIWLGGASDAIVVLETGDGYDKIMNYQAGSTRFKFANPGNLTYTDSAAGLQISQGNDLLAVVAHRTTGDFGTPSFV
ncbi:choice-of-anchor I family protein [filamentous cyanobacterium LEGE 11480]|uniref:Choice-of-anchor I family protein n=1 Tax=Romeriopsis navalis LEGE 11480 TaxID=2777977 RepID=A0A928VJJ7_9CYAN|nr:choice-of-anchor I family protein [Romeriopsis navalis]MBE9028913.1 choice-of-anchor I family protein [Romeriopsis navalis LEGE 11480]